MGTEFYFKSSNCCTVQV